jgi:hypothetical protein
VALTGAGDQAAAGAAFGCATSAIAALRRGGRSSEATLAEALFHAVHGREGDAIEGLRGLVERPELPFTGWTVPVEPLLAPLRKRPDYQAIAARLGDNAR